MSLHVIRSGILSMIVDRGRKGYQHLGITPAGAMDEHAFLWANYLLGNHMDVPQIEITYGLFKCQFEQPTVIALTGADLQAELSGIALNSWQTYRVKAGDTLLFKTPKTGLRTYLAIKDGFLIEPILGSCTTNLRDALGGHHQNGSLLNKKDCVAYNKSCILNAYKKVPERFIPDYQSVLPLKVMLGYQYTLFSQSMLSSFFSTEYQVSEEISRMGYRLKGAPLYSDSLAMLSEGISYGAIQIPHDGQPIILMSDRQTIGGYPKLGCIASMDLWQLAQRVSGSRVVFKSVEADTIREYKRRFEAFFSKPLK